MKKIGDPRHQKRVRSFIELFTASFSKQEVIEDFTKRCLENKEAIDSLIAKSAPLWPVEKIGKVDLAILRLAVYEMTIEKKTPPKVIIDEAIEIAKEFGGDSSPKFVNGALGKILSWIAS